MDGFWLSWQELLEELSGEPLEITKTTLPDGALLVKAENDEIFHVHISYPDPEVVDPEEVY